MTLDAIWKMVLGVVTDEVARVELAFRGGGPTGTVKKAEVLNTVSSLLNVLSGIFPGLPTTLILTDVGVAIDAIVAVSNTIGYFQHGGAPPRSSHP